MLRRLAWFEKSFRDLSEVEKAQLDELMSMAFPDDQDDEQADDAVELAPMHFLACTGNRIISNVGVVRREITCGGRRIVIGGVGGVATLPEWRKQGVAAMLLRRAILYMKQRSEFEFSMLFCDPVRIPYYSGFGYLLVNNPLYVHVHHEKRLFEDTKMVLPLAGRKWPDGEVDVMGPSW